MEFLLLIATVILFVLVFNLRKTVALLRSQISELEHHLAVVRNAAVASLEASPRKAEDHPIRRAARRAEQPPTLTEPADLEDQITDNADILSTAPGAIEVPEETNEIDEITDSLSNTPSAAKRFEDLVGGKLPIWIGGIALIFAGFFLVRFSIEAGLFGPVARCITAIIFGITLIGLSEFGHRIPKFGQIFSDDARIGHSISGAGIAILYATLYMASELYGLFGLTGALIGDMAITILAFFLSQKHGPPTAIMGLLGGFSAPFVAGLGPESVAPLLIYLGVFTGGIFGLAIYRGWAWLALLATGGSAIWSTALLLMDVTGDVAFVGLFITLMAVAGVLTISRTGTSFGLPKSIIQSIPLGVGLLQLMMLAPLIEFSMLGWLFFGILSIFSILLAWRDSNMTPSVPGALALSLSMIAMAFGIGNIGTVEVTAAIGFALLFGITGHVWSRREADGWLWAICGLLAPTGTLAVATLGDFGWSDSLWAMLCVTVAIPNAIMAWRTQDIPLGKIMPLATALTGILLLLALWLLTSHAYAAIMAGLVAAALAAWTRHTQRDAIVTQLVITAALGGLIMWVSANQLIGTLLASLAGETDLYRGLPAVSKMVPELLSPAIIMIGIAVVFRSVLGKMPRQFVATIGFSGTIGFLYLMLKQPLAIGPMQDFVRYGFAERIVFTNLLALVGWLLLWRNWSENIAESLRSIGIIFAGLALFRFVYFDIFLLSPTAMKQLLGGAPIANLGTLHYAGAALWLWLFARLEPSATVMPRATRALEISSLVAAIAAVMITVRQLVHGSDIATPPFTSAETYLYSAGLLVLAIAWLSRGIQTTNPVLRIAGLLLMTAVTFKVFIFDAAQLDGILRILSFLGLGIALIGIGWIHRKVMKSGEPETAAG